MKWLLCIVLTIIAAKAFAANHESDELKVLIEPKWQNLERNNTQALQFGGKWILIGSITFKKKIKDSLHLTKIDLHWNGAPLENLIGSLYDKPLDKEFIPIEESLLSDGHWNKNTQTLILKFNKSKSLNAVSTFCVVLTVPEKLESTLKHGSFDILTSSLPEPINAHMHDALRLSLDILDTISIKTNR